MALSEFGYAFLENLADLKTPDRRSIVTLKDLAFENPLEAVNVVRAIRQHIKQCPAAHRLPALYLVDCMLKTECPPVYSEQLNQSLLEIFVYVWDNSDAATQGSLNKLCKLWRTVEHLDKKVVQACETYMVPAGRASTSSGGGPVMGGTLLPPGHRGYPVTQPQPHPSIPYGRPPAAVGNGPAFSTRVFGQLGHAQQLTVPPAPFPAAHAVRPVYQQAAQPPTVLVSVQPPFIHPQQPQQSQVPFTAPQPQHMPFAVRPVASLPFAPNTGPAPIVMAGTVVPPAFIGMHTALPPIQQIAAPASPQPAPHSPQQQSQQQLQTSARPRSTEFPGSKALQELDETAVQDLREASNRTRPAFLDASFLRNKRRATQAVSGVPSRQWYPSVDLWLVGTTSADKDNAVGSPEGEKAESEEEKLYFVEEDPAQPECAISGEAFERFYDPDSDKWCYKDAVILTGEDAAKYDVMDGSIVKVQCLGGAPSKLQILTLRAATMSAAVAGELRQAAAQPDPAPGGLGGTASAPQGAGRPQQQQLPTAAATTAHLAQPLPVVKQEPHLGGPMGLVGAAPLDVHSLKRHAPQGDAGPGMSGAPGFHESKRVKLEVQ